MSLTQSMKISASYIRNAQVMLTDSMQSECEDPDYSLRLAIDALQDAIREIELVRKIRKELSAGVAKPPGDSMKTVHKYTILELDDTVEIKMPAMSNVVHVGSQHGLVCLWALVDPQTPLVARTFFIRGTGHPVEDGLTYLGTAHVDPFVWHVFGETQ